MTSLDALKGDVEGSYRELATVDAVRQVRTVKMLKEIDQLQEQLEVTKLEFLSQYSDYRLSLGFIPASCRLLKKDIEQSYARERKKKM